MICSCRMFKHLTSWTFPPSRGPVITTNLLSGISSSQPSPALPGEVLAVVEVVGDESSICIVASLHDVRIVAHFGEY